MMRRRGLDVRQWRHEGRGHEAQYKRPAPEPRPAGQHVAEDTTDARDRAIGEEKERGSKTDECATGSSRCEDFHNDESWVPGFRPDALPNGRGGRGCLT